MTGRRLCVLTLLLLFSLHMTAAQTFPPVDEQTGVATPLIRPKKPLQAAPDANISDQNSALKQQRPNAATATSREKKPTPQDPATTSVQRQSGLSESQARSLLQQKGYTSLVGLEAQPNSVWVWQADAMKNGRRLRLGIDYRGNVLELGASTAPCPLPGMNPNIGGVGIGTRLSDANRCTGR